MNVNVTFSEDESTFDVQMEEADESFKSNFSEVQTVNEGGGSADEVSTSDHSKLTNRDNTNQHPMSAITGLEEALKDKQPKGNYATENYVDEKIDEAALSGGSDVDLSDYYTKSQTDDAIREAVGGIEIIETDPTVPSWAKQAKKPSYTATEVGALPADTVIPFKTSQLENDNSFATESYVIGKINEAALGGGDGSGVDLSAYYTKTETDKAIQDAVDDIQIPEPDMSAYATKEDLNDYQQKGEYLTSFTETDPTVPSWAKEPTKPTYTCEEVGALPSTTKIPTKTSDLTNDSGFITSFTEKDPTVPSWAKQTTKPSYTASEVGADPSGSSSKALQSAKEYTDKQIAAIPTPDVSGQISAHNTATDAHNDLRLLIVGLTERMNALANSDDTTLDQMAEVVAYIKGNRELIEQVTTGKVSVSDVVDNLTTNVSDKPLSSAQGVVLKGLIDSLSASVGGKLDASALAEAINTALAQAKESGDFKGDDGISLVATVEQTDSGAVITISDKNGTTKTTVTNGKNGEDGHTPQKTVDYWTPADKQEIISETASMYPVVHTGTSAPASSLGKNGDLYLRVY